MQKGLLQRAEQAVPWEHYAFYVCAVLLVLAIIGLVVKIAKGAPKPATLTDVPHLFLFQLVDYCTNLLSSRVLCPCSQFQVADAKADIRKQMQDLQEAEKERSA